MTTSKNKRTGRIFLKPTRRKEQVGLAASARLTRRTPILITGTSLVASTIVITLDQDVILSGTPNYADSSATPLHPVSAAKTGIAEVTLTYASPPTSPFVVPFEDAAIRNSAAGYVQPGSYTAA